VSLFAGVGGIDLALERAGYDVVAAVEIDKAARGVIADRMPHTTLFDDVTEVSADDLRAAGFVPGRGLLAAGWPCQGNSVAGRRGGLADPRSGLWRRRRAPAG
jgi:DNA (cytosine-5)-methyltransferase 1